MLLLVLQYFLKSVVFIDLCVRSVVRVLGSSWCRKLIASDNSRFVFHLCTLFVSKAQIYHLVLLIKL